MKFPISLYVTPGAPCRISPAREPPGAQTRSRIISRGFMDPPRVENAKCRMNLDRLNRRASWQPPNQDLIEADRVCTFVRRQAANTAREGFNCPSTREIFALPNTRF